MFKHRSLMGNVCLVVLLAFILTFIPGTPGGLGGSGIARALTKTHDLAFDFSGTIKHIKITPVSSTDFAGYSLVLKFKDTGGNVVATFNVSSLPTLKLTNQLIAENTYGKVYARVDGSGNLLLDYVYAGSVNVGTTPGWVYAAIYDNVYSSVYLDVTIKPPTTGGGGVGGGAPAPTTVSTDTGAITVQGDTALVTLDPVKVADALNQVTGDTLEIRPPDQVKAGRYEVYVPIDLLVKAEEKGKGLAFVTAEAALTLPPGSVDLGEVRKLGADAKVRMVIQKVGETQAKELLQAAAPDQRPVGGVFEFDLRAVAGSGSQAREQSVTLSKPVRVAAAFDATKVGSGGRSYLGLYRNEGNAWAYRKSWVKAGADQVVGQLYSFSKYTVMAYRKRFTDTASHWAYADVDLMTAKHVVTGFPDLSFRPDGKVTRAEFAAMLVRALGLPEAPNASTFTDVASDAWYAGVVGAAAKAGVVAGYDDGTFRPNARITREQMAVMMARALKAAGKTVAADRVEGLLKAFSDRARISGWAREGVAAAADAGIVKGRGGGAFAPADDATRAEAAAMLKRYLGSVGQL